MLTDREKYAFTAGFTKGFIERCRGDIAELLTADFLLDSFCKRFGLSDEVRDGLQEDLIGLYSDMNEYCGMAMGQTQPLRDYMDKVLGKKHD